MHPSVHAKTHPDKPALIMAETGAIVTYGELDARSNQIARVFRSLGIERGDTIAVQLDNTARFLAIAWAAQRAGLYFVCVSTKLTPAEVNYIVRDSGAKAFVSSQTAGSTPVALPQLLQNVILFGVGEPMAGYTSLDDAAWSMAVTPVPDECAGADMLYSSGTTGQPKGIRIPLPADPDICAPTAFSRLMQGLWKFDDSSIYLLPAPLYHAAPLRSAMAVQKLGGTVVLMDRFEPEAALRAIETYRVTHSQWVPTHFVRMLKLPDEVRTRFDLSSLEVAIHAAAPCPIPVKETMIDWFGPIIYEYYAATEGNGLTAITSAEWLAHKGSVGKSVVGTVRICDESGEPVPPRTEGLVYIENGIPFSYHNDAEKTAEARNRHGWTTLGDIGWLDEDGFLYLTDRKSFMIISGGVNIYPQEIENLLLGHPKVLDVAVIGAPDPEMGEKVVAVVQPVDWPQAGDALAVELTQFARSCLSHVKAPRQIDFMQELPRHPNGKLYKRLLRDHYWTGPA